MKIRNAKHKANGMIDCEIEHPVYGWIPFGASPDDIEEHGRAIYAELIAGEHGAIEPYIAPPEPTAAEILQAKREAAVLTRREFYQAVYVAGLRDAVNGLKSDPATPIPVLIDMEEAQEYKRTWPTLVQAAAQLGVTDEQLDTLFGIV